MVLNWIGMTEPNKRDGNPNEIALVTGGKSGIGRNIAVQLARGGRRGPDLPHPQGRKQLSPLKSRRSGGRPWLNSTSLRWGLSALSAMPSPWHCRKAGGGGFRLPHQQRRHRPDGAFAETTEEAFDSLMNVHLKGVFFLTQTLLPLLSDGGRIVNTSSGLARFAIPGYSAYGARERARSRCLPVTWPRSWDRDGSASIPVAPGVIETDFTRLERCRIPVRKTFWRRTSPWDASAAPDDIGGVVAFLYESRRWVNGQRRLEASGGMFL